jgi:hypothetical protein
MVSLGWHASSLPRRRGINPGDRDGGLSDNMIDVLVNNQPGLIAPWS